MVLAIVTVPIYLEVIGLERYGILSIVWLVVGYFGLFDFGIGKAVAQRLATLSEGSDLDRSHVFWIGAALSIGLAVLAAALVYPAALASLHSMQLEDIALRQEIVAILPLLPLIVAIGIANSLLTGALEGRREFLVVNAISLIGASGATLVPLIAAWIWGPSLVHLVLAATATQVVALTLFCLRARRAVPIRRPDGIAPGEVRRLLAFGGWTSVSNLVAPLLTMADRFALGRVLGAAAVAVYAIPMSVVQNIAILPSAVGRSLFPRLAEGESTQSGALRDQASQAMMFLLTPMAVGAAMVMHPFLHLWVGADVAGKSFPIAMALIPGAWMTGHARIPYTHLMARGEPRKVALIHLGELVPYLASLWAGLHFFGLVGAAYAWTARATFDAALLHWRDSTPAPAVRRILVHGLFLGGAVTAIALYPPADARGIAVALAAGTLAALVALRDIPAPLAQRLKAVRQNSAQRLSRR